MNSNIKHTKTSHDKHAREGNVRVLEHTFDEKNRECTKTLLHAQDEDQFINKHDPVKADRRKSITLTVERAIETMAGVEWVPFEDPRLE